MQRITRERRLKYLFDKNVPPVIGVDPGERFVVETEDALSGRIQSQTDLRTPEKMSPLSDSEPPLGNPLAGPIYIRGAEKGDLLALDIEKIIPGEKGVTAIGLGRGVLSDSLCSNRKKRIHNFLICR